MHQSFFQLKIVCSVFFRTAFFVLLIFGFAAAEVLPIKNYTSADGLGSSFVSNLMRDSRGFLWFSTRDGLSRFDGSRFITYQVGERNAPPGIEQIIETKKGIYWIATTGGLYRFDPNAPAPKQNNSDRPVLNAEFVSERRGLFYEDKNEKLWFIDNTNLSILEEKDGKILFNRVEFNLPKNTSTAFGIAAVCQSSDGSFWIATTWGLARRLPDGRDVFYSVESLRTEALNSVLEDQAGRIWLAGSSGIYIFQPQPLEELSKLGAMTVHRLEEIAVPQTAVRLPQKSGEIFKLTAVESYGNDTTKSLYESADGRIWISTADGIIEFDGQSFHAYDAARGNITGSNAQIIEDLDGNLWIGGLKGLSRLDRRGLTSFNAADGLKNLNILAINESDDGKIYTGSNDYLISRFDGKKFETARPPLPAAARGAWTSNLAFLDSRNEWWFLTIGKAFRFGALEDFGAFAGQKPLAEYDSRNGLSGSVAYCIYEDRSGDVWISSRDTPGSGDGKLGLSKWNRATNTFHIFSAAENFPSGKSPSAFAEDEHGNLWIGFYEGGLVRYKNGLFESITNDLPPGLVTDLHSDKKGRLWFSTALSGINRIDDLTAEIPRIAHYKIENGLTSNNARSITEDDFGQIYVGTARGVDRITPETGQIKHYTTKDGLTGDFVQKAFRARDGALWFGTPNGLSRLIPQPETKSNAPPIWLSGLRIAGESQTVSQLGSSEISNLELLPAQNNLQIDFFGIDFRASESLRYQYRLEGADSDWSQPTEQRTVNYANLSSGNYRFLVRAIGADGAPSANPAVVSFRVLRPVWQRWWFLILAILIIGFLFYSIYNYRVRQLLKLERVRTRIATDLHDDIGSSLSQIAILSEVVRQKIGDNGAAAPLNLIAETSREMVDSMSDIVWAINPDKDHLSDLIQRMRRFASDVLEAQDIVYRFHLDEMHRDLALGADIRREVYLIFKESVNNLIKHAGATEVEMSVFIEKNSLIVKINDNGKGFVFSEAGSAAADSAISVKDYAGFGGNGLINMRRRTENLGGRFEIKSETNAGTEIKIEIPI